MAIEEEGVGGRCTLVEAKSNYFSPSGNATSSPALLKDHWLGTGFRFEE